MEKVADKPYVAGIAPEAVEANNKIKAEALRNIAKIGLTGAGAGAALAAVLGLPQLVNRPKIPSYPLQTEVELPYPQEVKKASVATTIAEYPVAGGLMGAAKGLKAEDKTEGVLRGGAGGMMQGLGYVPGAVAGEMLGQKGMQALRRNYPYDRITRLAKTRVLGTRRALPMLAAGIGGTATGLPLSGVMNALSNKAMGEPRKSKSEKKADLADSIVQKTMSATPGDPAPTVGSPRWMRGDSQTSAGAIPWALPGYMAAGLGGLFGGHELVRRVLQKRRKAELDRELQTAQKEYDDAMLSQYDPAKLRNLSGIKEASSTTLLDACFDMLEKRGFLGMDFNDLAGRGAGAYLTLAGLLGTGSGIGMYKWLQSRSGDKVLKDALKRRAALRSMQNPTELYVRPVPVEYVDDTSNKS